MTGDGTDNEVSGVVHGLSIQARDVGGLHIHPPPVVADCLVVLTPFALLFALAVLLSYIAPWS